MSDDPRIVPFVRLITVIGNHVDDQHLRAQAVEDLVTLATLFGPLEQPLPKFSTRDRRATGAPFDQTPTTTTDHCPHADNLDLYREYNLTTEDQP